MNKQTAAPASYLELVARFKHLGSSADVAHAVLRHSIIHSRLPPGARFRAEDLAKEFGMSRTPIREAQLRLEAEGLLAVKPGVGLVVREFSEDQIIEIYYVREALEGMAAGLAAENASAHERTLLRDIVVDIKKNEGGEDLRLLRDLSGEFHLAVSRASHNAYLFSTIKELQEKFRRFQPSSLTNAQRAAEAVAELDDILRGVEQRNPEQAEAAARRHRRRTLALHLQRLRTTYSSGQTSPARPSEAAP